MAKSLGQLEIVKSSPARASNHIEALEKRVDDLTAENRELKAQLKAKPSTVTQEEWLDLCHRYSMEVSNNLPF